MRRRENKFIAFILNTLRGGHNFMFQNFEFNKIASKWSNIAIYFGCGGKAVCNLEPIKVKAILAT